jgi:hypothetical protein
MTAREVLPMPHAVRITLVAWSLFAASLARADAGPDAGPEPEPAESPAAEAPAAPGLGIAPTTPQVGDLIVPTSSPPGAAAPQAARTFNFHGFLRVPMRVGFGPGGDVAPGTEGGVKTHAPPQVPDGAYTDWQYTNGMGGPWTEVWLSYGSKSVSAHVVFAAYDVSDASYRDPQSQLGISQSFVSLSYPRLLGGRGGLWWNVGAFTGRYGAAGRYDAGKYDTYLFGATHVAGETLALSYDVGARWTVRAEHGIGAKLQVVPLVPGLPSVPYFPYPGPVQQGSTLLHHAHVGATWDGTLSFALHYLTSWTDDARAAGEVDGRITVVGGEVKLVDSVWGNGYLGVARLESRDPLRVAGALEVLHSFEGWSLRNNFFGPMATGTGTIDTILFQHTFSLATYLWAPQKFWGQGPDLLFSVFGMWNRVASDDPAFTGATRKLKLGGEVTTSWKRWLGLSLRWDLVQPDMDDSRESFQVISPRLILRSDFVSNEQLVIQYSRYIHGENVRLPYPYQGLAPDEDVVKVQAIMWW